MNWLGKPANRTPSPPPTVANWNAAASSNFLVFGGARGPMHIQTLAFVGGNSPSPMQRLGHAPMFVLGLLPPDTNDVAAGFGTRFPTVDDGHLFQPVLTMAGAKVSSMKTSAR